MDVKEGNKYVLKNGEVVGPVVWDDVIEVWRRSPDFDRETGDYWHSDGSRYGHVEDDLDFASEANSRAINKTNGDKDE